MTALTNHTIGTAFCNGYGRCQAVPVWISVARKERRVVFFPPFNMNIIDKDSAPKERQLYLIDFSSVGIWATEDQHLAKLVYNYFEGECPRVCETCLLTDMGYDLDNHPYRVLNNQDGSFHDTRESQTSHFLNAAALKLLETCKQYSQDCATRIEVIQDEEGQLCECEDKSDHDRYCNAGEQICHWQATKMLVDAVIREAEGN